MLPFSLPLVSPSSTSLVMKFFSSQVEDLINGDKVRAWHTLWFFSGKASFFLPLPSSLFRSFFPLLFLVHISLFPPPGGSLSELSLC